MNLKKIEEWAQLLSPKRCLACDGCCRFHERMSLWRPKLLDDEIARWPDLYPRDRRDEENCLKTKAGEGGFICQFFNEQENRCTIYQQRPWDCRLYPFLLVRRGHAFFVGVHTACPFIKENAGSQPYGQYVDGLKQFFLARETLVWLRRNTAFFGDYDQCQDEITSLFDLPLKEDGMT